MKFGIGAKLVVLATALVVVTAYFLWQFMKEGASEIVLRAREKISWAILLNPRKRSALGFNISPC